MERRWRGIRLRAERRYGELLGPKRPGKRTSDRLSEVEHKSRERARKVAAVPAEKFEDYLSSEPEASGRASRFL